MVAFIDIEKISLFYSILLLSGILFGIFSSVPALEKDDYFQKLPFLKKQLSRGVFFQFAMALVYTLKTVILFPVVQLYDDHLALGYLVFSMIGSIYLYLGMIPLLLFVTVGRQGFRNKWPDSSTVIEIIRISRDWINHMGMILPWSLGLLILYYCLYRLDLIPVYLSVWALISVLLTLLSTFLYMFSKIRISSVSYFILNAPTALFEIYLALFLIIAGFIV